MRNERLTDRLGEVTNGRRNIAVSEAKRGKLALSLLRKGRGYIQRSRREGGAMRKEEICNMDCLHCVHPDCINDETLTRQARYYRRHRERVLEKKKEDYQKRKAEKDGGLQENAGKHQADLREGQHGRENGDACRGDS